MENEVRKFLSENNIEFEQQKTFEWLRHKNPMFLDFYLPKYNVAIECQGEQHFKPINYFGGECNFLNVTERDKLKFELCKQHIMKLIYFTHCNYQYHCKLITSLNELKELFF